MDLLIYLVSFIITIVAIYLFMVAPRMINRADRTPFKNVHYAHRGLFNSNYPENSLSAFENAVKSNYGIELDVQFTKDKKIVVFHDDNLERLTGDTRDVKDVEYKELKSLKLENTQETIPTLKEVIRIR